MSTNSIGEKIRQARMDAHLSQKDLSEALLISEKAISSYEAGRTVPTVKTLQGIAGKTDKPITYFTDESTDVKASITMLLTSIDKQLAQIKKLLSAKPL